MVDKSEGYAQPRRAMILRNFFAACVAIPLGVMASMGVSTPDACGSGGGVTASIIVGVVVAVLLWVGVMFVSAKGH